MFDPALEQLAEMIRRLTLVGLLGVDNSAFPKGSLTQLAMGTLFSLFFLCLQMLTTPFANTLHNCLAHISSLALTLFFFIALTYQWGPTYLRYNSGAAHALSCSDKIRCSHRRSSSARDGEECGGVRRCRELEHQRATAYLHAHADDAHRGAERRHQRRRDLLRAAAP
jgi:hypothetical protein